MKDVAQEPARSVTAAVIAAMAAGLVLYAAVVVWLAARSGNGAPLMEFPEALRVGLLGLAVAGALRTEWRRLFRNAGSDHAD